MIAIINEQQRELLRSLKVTNDTKFNVDIFDINNNCVIDELEINQCDIQWLKDLPLIDYQPKPQTTPFE